MCRMSQNYVVRFPSREDEMLDVFVMRLFVLTLTMKMVHMVTGKCCQSQVLTELLLRKPQRP